MEGVHEIILGISIEIQRSQKRIVQPAYIQVSSITIYHISGDYICEGRTSLCSSVCKLLTLASVVRRTME